MTSDPGTNALVTNSGTECNAVLNFVIPRGVNGATGDTGPQGPIGPTGPQGPAGTSATVTVGTTVPVKLVPRLKL